MKFRKRILLAFGGALLSLIALFCIVCVLFQPEMLLAPVLLVSKVSETATSFFEDVGDEAITERAIKEKNYEICKEIFPEYERIDSNCMVLFIEAYPDEKLCEIPEVLETMMGSSCYETVAVARKEYTICEKLDDESEKDRCYYAVSSIKGDIDGCNKAGEEKDECINQVALTLGDAEICDKISKSAIYINPESCRNAINIKGE